MAANQNSIISYVPQPYFTEGLSTVVNQSNVDSIDNSDGLFDPDLSNYVTINPTSGVTQFAVKIDFNKNSDHLTDYDMTLGFIGCSLLTYEDDGFGSPDLATEFTENINCVMSSNITAEADNQISYSHNSEDSIHTFSRVSLPGIISGGLSNLIFNGLGASNTASTATVYATINRSSADASARPHAVLLIGHLFIGVDIPIAMDPRVFSWTMQVENERFLARDFGTINADGTLVKRATGEILKIDNYSFIGSQVTQITPSFVATPQSNFFDLVKINTSYPLLLNPYPAGQVESATVTLATINLTSRQNFFSIYGFLEDPLQLQVGEYRDGLDTEYKLRFRIRETR